MLRVQKHNNPDIITEGLEEQEDKGAGGESNQSLNALNQP